MAGYNSSAFNSILGNPSWMDQISSFSAPGQLVPMQINSITDIAGPNADAGFASALDRYSAGLGKMQTKDWIGAGLGGLQTIGGLIGAFGSLNLANKQYGLQKRMAETNLTNSVQAYNTALEDKARSRAVMEGQSEAERDEYIRRNSATTGR